MNYDRKVHASKLREFLDLARIVKRAMEVDITWEERYDVIFSKEVSKRIFELVDLDDYCDPDTNEQEDVEAFASAVAEKEISARRMLEALNG